jgi:hypothetical protein
MSSFMILFVSNTGEYTLTILALIGFLSSMSPQMHHEVSLLRERTATIGMSALKKLKT